jgi:superfamily II DNA or RNA helicase
MPIYPADDMWDLRPTTHSSTFAFGCGYAPPVSALTRRRATRPFQASPATALSFKQFGKQFRHAIRFRAPSSPEAYGWAGVSIAILHGAWIAGESPDAGAFALWGEASRPRNRARTARGHARGDREGPQAHPFAASAVVLRQMLASAGVGGALDAHTRRHALATLPSTSAGPLPSWLDVTEAASSSMLVPWTIPVVTCGVSQAIEMLPQLPEGPGQYEAGDDLRFWALARLFVLELLTRQHFLPLVEEVRGGYAAHWRPLIDEEADSARFSQLATSMPGAAAALHWHEAPAQPGRAPLLRDFVGAAVDALARRSLEPLRPARTNGQAPKVHPSWRALRDEPRVVARSPREAAEVANAWKTWNRPALDPTAEAAPFRVCFRLDPPPPPTEAAEPGVSTWSVSFLLQAVDDPSLLVPAEEVWRQRGPAARFLGRRLHHPQEHLLAGLGRAARVAPAFERSLSEARPVSCRMTPPEAYTFIRESALILQSGGFGVLVPGLDARLGVRARLGNPRSSSTPTAGPARMSWDAVVSYDWEIALGDETLSREEFEMLAALKQPLVQVRGRWVELREEQIAAALAFFAAQPAPGEMALTDAIKLALAPDAESGMPALELTVEPQLAALLDGVGDGDVRDEIHEPAGFVGQLRPYQRVGVAWLAGLRRYGLGACLADDMGLGKTIQLIATLLHARERAPDDAPAPTLLICPTSVLGNWRHELERFAPTLRVLMHHGADRERAAFATDAARHDIVLSSYAVLHRDEAALRSVQWDTVVLDEAQNIKNPATRAAQVARQLPARWRVALTGTPVENRLAELWSILEFLNPGYLGSAEQFRRTFANPIERARDSAATARLKAVTAPFILRRVKSDRRIIEELPEKNEAKVFCTLTREQATLYEAVVRDGLRQVEEAEGIQRRGQVLAMLTKLKQVCDHPALFLHDGSSLAGRSGKLARLTEMAEELVAAGDRALVFTQYAGMGRLLQAHLTAALGHETLFLHGGTPATARDAMVARFQAAGAGPALFVLSLKAGGIGLNLTRANHVFHFDRWWNPAVEDQATDRAYRIGQRRDVQVHKLLCAGTMEEAIDDLIEEKVALAEAIVGTNEAWITEMGNAELMELLALRPDAVVDE